MTVTRSIYKDYAITCSAKPVESGGFQAQVAMVSMKGDKTRSQRFLDVKEVHATPDEAIEKGMEAAIEWIESTLKLDESRGHMNKFLNRY